MDQVHFVSSPSYTLSKNKVNGEAVNFAQYQLCDTLCSRREMTYFYHSKCLPTAMNVDVSIPNQRTRWRRNLTLSLTLEHILQKPQSLLFSLSKDYESFFLTYSRTFSGVCHSRELKWILQTVFKLAVYLNSIERLRWFQANFSIHLFIEFIQSCLLVGLFFSLHIFPLNLCQSSCPTHLIRMDVDQEQPTQMKVTREARMFLLRRLSQ